MIRAHVVGRPNAQAEANGDYHNKAPESGGKSARGN